jgi:nucleotide-binding universal stress UspA family protein
MKSITVHAYDEPGFDHRLQVALDIARGFGGHVTIVYPVPVDVGMPADFYGATFASLTPIWREAAEKLRAKTEADLAHEDVPWNWIEGTGMTAPVLLRHSALSDLLVVGATEPQLAARGPSETVGDLALHGRCPVLVVPEGQAQFDINAPVLVGWDGSAEASRALRSAMPLLARAASVTLACVKEREAAPDDYDLPPLKGAEYLSRHGIACELVELRKGDRRVAEVLREAAAQRRAGTIVMGAYGHMRLAERIFGGATRDMLTEVKVPLFMTH